MGDKRHQTNVYLISDYGKLTLFSFSSNRDPIIGASERVFVRRLFKLKEKSDKLKNCILAGCDDGYSKTT